MAHVNSADSACVSAGNKIAVTRPEIIPSPTSYGSCWRLLGGSLVSASSPSEYQNDERLESIEPSQSREFWRA